MYNKTASSQLAIKYGYKARWITELQIKEMDVRNFGVANYFNLIMSDNEQINFPIPNVRKIRIYNW